MVGGNGADFVNGGVGTDVEVLGNGDDTAAWNPGEGNDAIDGGLGRDTLAFNGADGDEQMSLSANGRSAVFLRVQGNIRMDLDGVERLDLATFGGADTVTIDDLSGTEVTAAEIDLAATTGGADARIDTVQVNGSAGPTGSTSRPTAARSRWQDWLPRPASPAATRPTYSASTRSGGNDQVTVSDQARALLDIQADLGADQ